MARRSRDEAGAQDLSGIEDGSISSRCFSCGQKQMVMIKIHRNEVGNSVQTKNKMGACTNPKCFRWMDIRQLNTWVREDDPSIVNLQPLGSSRSGMIIA